MNEVLVDIRNMSAGYDGNLALKEVSLQVFEQDFLGIIGPNGGGKTTLIKTILGLIKPVSGVITKNSALKENIGYMPQTNLIDTQFPILVAEVVESGLMAGKGLSTSEKKKKVQAVISEMGIETIVDKAIGELSGGQLQRTLLARAIVNDPVLLILDEPNAYVDKRFESRFYQLLQEINRRTAIMLVSHDIGTVISNVKNIACVNETLHYHSGTDVTGDWLEEHLACPFEVIAHGDVPHRVLKKH
ncbi:MAG: ATP-binding cassette domain-containing protein [Dysgonamonadaceae bacterium]|jgi:zinc transport system ATP-binding protein|nr:ATP-binding cassette domain-containing protein [Dysgonamonadaceae bacterium]